MISIDIVGPVWSFILEHGLAMLGGIWSIVGVVVVWIAKKYLVPWLKVDERKKYATYIVQIADEMIEAAMAKWPGEKWLGRVDEIIEELAKVCDISLEAAKRVVNAQVAYRRNNGGNGNVSG